MTNVEGPNDFLRLGQWLQEDQRFLEIAEHLDREGRKRVILDRESKEPYLVRYYYQNFRPHCRIVIHHVLRSDVDGLHDHPWAADTFILSGGYWESKLIVPNLYPLQDRATSKNVERLWRPAGYHGQFSSNYYHRLELDPDKAQAETWTLFMMGPKEKDWGFMDQDGEWVQHEEYLDGRKLHGV